VPKKIQKFDSNEFPDLNLANLVEEDNILKKLEQEKKND